MIIFVYLVIFKTFVEYVERWLGNVCFVQIFKVFIYKTV